MKDENKTVSVEVSHWFPVERLCYWEGCIRAENDRITRMVELENLRKKNGIAISLFMRMAGYDKSTYYNHYTLRIIPNETRIKDYEDALNNIIEIKNRKNTI